MVRLIKRLLADKRGVTALEYGLIASVLVGAVTLGFTALANDLSSTFQHVAATIAEG